jgi:hypothetical protein
MERIYVLEDHIPLRVRGAHLADVENYRGTGQWVSYMRLVNFVDNA